VLSVVQPVLLIFVPLALLFIALPPRRPFWLALALFLGYFALMGRADGSLWYIERGWALVLGAWFVVIVALVPAWGFLSSALSALVLSGLTAVGFAAANHGGLGRRERARQ
jgi:hypothetical protein